MQQTSAPPAIKALVILHKALFAGQVLMAIILSFITYIDHSPPGSPLKSYVTEIMLLCIGIGIAGYLGGNLLFRKKLDQINRDAEPLSEKFNNYRSASITRWALLEFAVLLSLILFFVSKIELLLIVAVVLILLFLKIGPSLEKTARDLNVSEAEIEEMNPGTSM